MLECDRRASLSLKELYLLQQRVGKALELTGSTTTECRMEFDKVWWGFLSFSDSVLCCQTGGTR